MLRLDGRPVAEYADGRDLDPTLAPRPHLHPVLTLGGTPVSDAQPPDHRWHLGLSVALQDVEGWNFWGGPTYLRGQGYIWRDDHGRIEHMTFTALGDDGFAERLRWLTPQGESLIAEQRLVRGRLVEHGWELEIVSTLTNTARRPLRLGSPATNGRDGAGYGGLFWRLPRAADRSRPGGSRAEGSRTAGSCPGESQSTAAREPHVRTRSAEGERAVHGSVAPWLAWTDHAFTLVLSAADAGTRADPWFVRVGDYPGVGSQLAARNPVTLDIGGAVTRGLRALVADGPLDDRAARAWALRRP